MGKDSLDGDIHSWGVEGLEHDLGHLFSVGLGVQWGLGQEDWVLFGGNTKLIVEGVMPDLLHVIPVGNNTVLNWVLQGEDTSLGLGFISNIGVLLSHTDHDTLMSWSSKWMGRQLLEHHLRQIQLCTYRIRYQQREQQHLRHI